MLLLGIKEQSAVALLLLFCIALPIQAIRRGTITREVAQCATKLTVLRKMSALFNMSPNSDMQRRFRLSDRFCRCERYMQECHEASLVCFSLRNGKYSIRVL